jgi:hypothetical protein
LARWTNWACCGQNLGSAIFLNSKINRKNSLFSFPNIEKANTKILMSKSDIMTYEKKGKKVFYYSNNLLCKHHVWLWLATLIVLFHILDLSRTRFDYVQEIGWTMDQAWGLFFKGLLKKDTEYVTCTYNNIINQFFFLKKTGICLSQMQMLKNY